MRNQSETRKGKRAGLEHLWSTTAVVVWMGFVGAAIARFVAWRVAREWMLHWMVGTAGVVVSSLFYVLLG